MIAGSFFRVIWYACHTWWYQRVFFTLGACSVGRSCRGPWARSLPTDRTCSGRQRASRLAASWRDVVGSPRCASASGIGRP